MSALFIPTMPTAPFPLFDPETAPERALSTPPDWPTQPQPPLRQHDLTRLLPHFHDQKFLSQLIYRVSTTFEGESHRQEALQSLKQLFLDLQFDLSLNKGCPSQTLSHLLLERVDPKQDAFLACALAYSLSCIQFEKGEYARSHEWAIQAHEIVKNQIGFGRDRAFSARLALLFFKIGKANGIRLNEIYGAFFNDWPDTPQSLLEIEYSLAFLLRNHLEESAKEIYTELIAIWLETHAGDLSKIEQFLDIASEFNDCLSSRQWLLLHADLAQLQEARGHFAEALAEYELINNTALDFQMPLYANLQILLGWARVLLRLNKHAQAIKLIEYIVSNDLHIEGHRVVYEEALVLYAELLAHTDLLLDRDLAQTCIANFLPLASEARRQTLAKGLKKLDHDYPARLQNTFLAPPADQAKDQRN